MGLENLKSAVKKLFWAEIFVEKREVGIIEQKKLRKKCIFELKTPKITQIRSFMKNEDTKIDEMVRYSLLIFVDDSCQALKNYFQTLLYAFFGCYKIV